MIDKPFITGGQGLKNINFIYLKGVMDYNIFKMRKKIYTIVIF